MKSDFLDKIANLEVSLSEDGKLMTLAEEYLNDKDLTSFAENISLAKDYLQKAASVFVKNAAQFTEEDVAELAILAQSLDDSGDEVLQKQASVLDEILVSIGADPKAQMVFKKAESDEIERLRAKYQDTNHDEYTKAKEQMDKENEVSEAIKAIDKKVKKYRPLEASLNTRYSPDMPGVSLVRIGDGIWQCPITKKIYNFRDGYTSAKGNVVPGTDVANQTQNLGYRAQEHMNFSTRESALNGD